jgi:secreted Zn-dependent insulinase-like peptidase
MKVLGVCIAIYPKSKKNFNGGFLTSQSLVKNFLETFFSYNIFNYSLLATSVDVEEEVEEYSIYTVFCIRVTLTEYGLENVELVLDAIFSFLLLLKEEGPSKEYFDYLQEASLKSFNFIEEQDASENANDLVGNIEKYAPEDIIRGDTLYSEYNEAEIKSIIDYLNERKFNLVIMTDKFEKYDKEEKWYKTEYAEVDFPASFSEHWNNRSLKDELYLPKRNPFNCTNFEIYYKEGDEVPVCIEHKLYVCSLKHFQYPLAFRNFHKRYFGTKLLIVGIDWMINFCFPMLNVTSNLRHH